MNRRSFIKKAATAGALLSSSSLFGSKLLAGDLFVRKNIASLDPDGPEMTALRAGIAAMKTLASSNPRSWAAQAQIHLSYCPHGNWYFLPWHRAFIYFFEKICRQASGDPTFALPYWDWTRQPTFPVSFLGNAKNPLYDPARPFGLQPELDPAWVSQPVIDGLMAITDFETFASPKPDDLNNQVAFKGFGQFEGLPHNFVHGWIGFDGAGMPAAPTSCLTEYWQPGLWGHMAEFCSPLDPIFWMHHCNTDRIWASWNRCRANTTHPAWRNFVFDEFFDADTDSQASVPISSLQTPAGLGYSYDLLEGETPICRQRKLPQTFAERDLDRKDTRAWAQGGGISFEVDLSGLLATIGEFDQERGTSAILQIEGLESPADPTSAIRIFVDHPEASATTPLSDPRYGSQFTFFVHQHDPTHPGHGVGSRLDITRPLRKLADQGRLRGKNTLLSVQLVRVPGRHQNPAIRDQEMAPPHSVRLMFLR